MSGRLAPAVLAEDLAAMAWTEHDAAARDVLEQSSEILELLEVDPREATS